MQSVILKLVLVFFVLLILAVVTFIAFLNKFMKDLKEDDFDI